MHAFLIHCVCVRACMCVCVHASCTTELHCWLLSLIISIPALSHIQIIIICTSGRNTDKNIVNQALCLLVVLATACLVYSWTVAYEVLYWSLHHTNISPYLHQARKCQSKPLHPVLLKLNFCGHIINQFYSESLLTKQDCIVAFRI